MINKKFKKLIIAVVTGVSIMGMSVTHTTNNKVYAEAGNTVRSVKICNTIQNVKLDKPWKIHFNRPVNPNTLKHIFVIPENYSAAKMQISTSKDRRTVYIIPSCHYLRNHNYTVLIYNVQSARGEKLKPSYFTFRTMR